MQCPQCGYAKTQVSDTRYSERTKERKRHRRCLKCNKRFVTVERIRHERNLPRVVKRDGRREEFAEEKLHAGIQQALAKSPVSTEAKTALIERVIQKVADHHSAEISWERLGQIIMYELRDLDMPSYIRFASVYRNFKDIGAFKRELEQIDDTDVQQLNLPWMDKVDKSS